VVRDHEDLQHIWLAHGYAVYGRAPATSNVIKCHIVGQQIGWQSSLTQVIMYTGCVVVLYNDVGHITASEIPLAGLL
jgi:hypothetical protein